MGLNPQMKILLTAYYIFEMTSLHTLLIGEEDITPYMDYLHSEHNRLTKFAIC